MGETGGFCRTPQLIRVQVKTRTKKQSQTSEGGWSPHLLPTLAPKTMTAAMMMMMMTTTS